HEDELPRLPGHLGIVRHRRALDLEQGVAGDREGRGRVEPLREEEEPRHRVEPEARRERHLDERPGAGRDPDGDGAAVTRELRLERRRRLRRGLPATGPIPPPGKRYEYAPGQVARSAWRSHSA